MDPRRMSNVTRKLVFIVTSQCANKFNNSPLPLSPPIRHHVEDVDCVVNLVALTQQQTVG
jgi:hypothetical protein